jgi:hypothetical protein
MKAYPFIHKHPTTGNTKLEEGMDLRDYFAAKAMQGICNSRSHSELKGHAIASAKVAYELADAMMKEREVKNEHS